MAQNAVNSMIKIHFQAINIFPVFSNCRVSQLNVTNSNPRWLTGARYFHVSTSLQDEVKIVTVPQFADSISEGDVRWEKGMEVYDIKP